MEKFCKSCGMPMDKIEDFANNDINSDYCYYCGDKDEYYNKEESHDREDYLEKERHYNKKESKLKVMEKSYKKPKKIKKTIKKTTKKADKKKK